ncbi:MAG: hypothetical protein JSW02_10835 [candidate division WOR-3 bacterium]|nr:MAG: hypothetical protein JSW02_10835 [candidate division WOR-3 bacterium]
MCKKYLSICVTIIITFLHINVLYADRPTAAFLNIPPGAKVLGRGAGFTGDCLDPASIHYNPAAIVFHDKFTLTVLNQGLPPGLGRLIQQGILVLTGEIFYGTTIKPESPWLDLLRPDMVYNNFSYVMSVHGIGTVGINATYLTTGVTDVYTIDGVYVGSFESYDAAAGISYGRTFLNRFGFGITGKYIYSYLTPEWVFGRLPELGIPTGGTGTAWAADFGILYRLWGMNVGASVQNLGTKVRYSLGDSLYRLPLRIRGSVSIEPLIFLDSLLHTPTVKIFDKPIYDVVNLKFNYDRAYDPYEPDDTWNSFGFEVTLWNFFSYRTGEWNIMGTSRGIGFNLRNVEIDVAKYFTWDTYHVQLTFHSINPPDNIKNNLKLHRSLIAASSVLAPGGGQFYKGEGIKGSLFFVPAMYLGRTILTSDSDSDKTYAAAGLIILYIGAGIEAILTN